MSADLGVKTAHAILETLREKADRKQIRDAAELKRLLKEEILAILTEDCVRNNRRLPKGQK